MVVLVPPENNLKNMSNPVIQNIMEKISQIFKDFFQKEEEIKKAGQEVVLTAIKKSDDKKITEIKEKINKI